MCRAFFNRVRKKNIRKLIKFIDVCIRDFRDKAPFVGIYTHRTPGLMVLDTHLVKEILVGKFKHFQNNYTNVRISLTFSDFSKQFNWLVSRLPFNPQYNKENARLFGRNPFILRGNEWKENRADISPAFTTTKVCGSTWRCLVALVISYIN